MDDQHNNDSEKQSGRSFLDELRQLRADADKGREPNLLASRMGTRMVSQAALLERIVAAFIDEHGGDSVPLREADTEGKRLSLILATADYVIGVESVILSPAEKADLVRKAYAELFTYGPLDPLFEDERITTILIEGSDKTSVRYGHGDLTALGPLFEDENHMRKVVRRLLLDSGAELYPEEPIIEAGLRVGRRPVSINVALPPVSFQITADIRVHPSQPLALDDLVRSEIMTNQAASLLTAIAQSPHGVVIIGETESGKTTLLGVMARIIAASTSMIAVERTGEMHLPDAVERLTVKWPSPERERVTFGEQVYAALEKAPLCIVLDEIRTDEAQAIAPLLTSENPPRQLWAFRGPTDSKRLASALGMLARRSDSGGGEALVRALYERLPFVISVRRTKERLQLRSIAEWQYPDGADYPNYVELMEAGYDGLVLTGRHLLRALPLGEDFWANA